MPSSESAESTNARNHRAFAVYRRSDEPTRRAFASLAWRARRRAGRTPRSETESWGVASDAPPWWPNHRERRHPATCESSTAAPLDARRSRSAIFLQPPTAIAGAERNRRCLPEGRTSVCPRCGGTFRRAAPLRQPATRPQARTWPGPRPRPGRGPTDQRPSRVMRFALLRAARRLRSDGFS